MTQDEYREAVKAEAVRYEEDSYAHEAEGRQSAASYYLGISMGLRKAVILLDQDGDA